MSGQKKRTTKYPVTKLVLVNASFLTFAALTAFISTRGLPGSADAASAQPTQKSITAPASTPQPRAGVAQPTPAPARRAARIPVARSRGS